MKRFKLLTMLAAAFLMLSVQSANAFTLTCLRGSSFGEGEGCQKLFDGTQDTKWGTWDGWYGNPVYTVAKATMPIAPTSYSLRIANDTYNSPGRNWKSWRIFGGNFASDDAAVNDAEGWVLLDQKVDEAMTTDQFAEVQFDMSNPDGNFYSYFMIIVDAICSNPNWDDYTQMDEFWFRDFKVDTSAAQAFVDFDYTTDVDADLQAAYAEKVAALSAAIETGDPDQIVPAVDAIVPIYNEINKLRNGDFIALEWTATWGDGPGSNLVDKNDYTKWGGGFPGEGEHVQYVVFRTPAQQPYFYKLVTGGDTEKYSDRNWKTWKVFGGNFASEAEATRAAEGWVVLDERENVGSDILPAKNNAPAPLKFSNEVTEKYSYYKVEVTASGGGAQQMSELYLCTQEDFEVIRGGFVEDLAEFAAGLDDLVIEPELASEKENFAALYEELKTTTDADQLTILHNELLALQSSLEYSAAFVAGGYRVLEGNTAWGDNENWTKLLDGNESTKWGGGMPEGGSYVIFKTFAASKFGVYKLITGNDTKNSPDRNWKDWQIFGAGGKVNDGNATRDLAAWTLLDKKENIGQDQLPGDNFAPAFFSFSEEWTKEYKYFKIEVSAAYNNGGNIQMSEFRMLTDEEWQAARQEYVDALTAQKKEMYAGQEVAPEVEDMIATAIATVANAEPGELLVKYAEAQEVIAGSKKQNFLAKYKLTEINGVLQLGTAEDVVNFAKVINDGTEKSENTFIDAVLTDDIDLSGVIPAEGWTPIGNWGAVSYGNACYKGHFDGQGYSITGFNTVTPVNNFGFFGVISTGAVIENFSIYGTITNSIKTGGAIGFARDDNPTIRNVKSYLTINNTSVGARLGGILGTSFSGSTVNIDRCTFSGTIDGNDNAGNGNYGGIVGYTQNNATTILNVTNCLFDGKLINTAATPGGCTFGGIVGYIGAGPLVTVKNCLSIGTVQSQVTGQFFGAVKNTTCSILNSYYKGANINGSASTVELPAEQLTVTKVNDEQLASGEIAMALGEAFSQTVGEDAYPVIDDAHGIVKKISEAGYATMYIAEAVKIPAGVVAATGSINEETQKLTLNPLVDVVPSWEPVVLKGEAGYYSFVPTECLEDGAFVNFSTLGFENAEVLTKVSVGDLTITFDKSVGNTDPAYYLTGSAARLYGSNTMTISANRPIIKIRFVFGEGVAANVPEDKSVFSEGSYNPETTTWTGSAETLTLTRPASRGHYRILGMVVTFNAGEIVKVADNVFKGTTEDIDAAGKYILAKPAGQPAGFYKATQGTIKAGKAYLELPEGVDIKAFYFEEDEATGISNVDNAQIENGAIYNLAGQRLNKVQKGINIINGKKVLK
ncbi:MAG: hypothetical protein IK144_06540 [Bacteroidaceae bacterium]|nr:hypothetical protein [Bacteroidaceae bacterium]